MFDTMEFKFFGLTFLWFGFIVCCALYVIYLFRRLVIAVEKIAEKQK